LEESRRALIEYYSSQTTAHVGYIVAIVIGGLTLVSRWDVFFPTDPARANLVISASFFAILSILFGFGVNIIGRTLYWSALTHSIINKVSCDLALPMENPPRTLVDEATKGLIVGARSSFLWAVAIHFSHTKLEYVAGVSAIGFAFMFLSFVTNFSPVVIYLVFLAMIFVLSFWRLWKIFKKKAKYR
jgi:hypothetical protein